MPESHSVSPAADAHLRALDSARLAEATGVFAMLSDATRLHLLWLLAQEESDVGSLTERIDATPAAMLAGQRVRVPAPRKLRILATALVVR